MYESDLQHPSPKLQEKLYALYDLGRDNKIDLSFRPPFLELLDKLGNPHLNLPPVIHVAGTNGKGSTIAMMRAVLEAAGHKVHVYTSPHLIQFNERIILAGQMISNEALEPLIDEVMDINGGQDITFFEITTALAFAAFARSPADFTLLEVGLGGRLDCTNIIHTAKVSVIGRIGIDHEEFLGNSIEDIALEKAGIMKANVPCVVGVQRAEAMAAIEQRAQEIGTPLIKVDTNWPDDLPHPNLTGNHQIYNAGLALAAMKTLDQNISNEALAEGLRNVRWPARLQKLDYNPAPGFEVWLDGGHNADAAQALVNQIQKWKAEDDKPLYLILGMMAHKDPQSFIEPLLEHASATHIIDIPGERGCLRAEDIPKAEQGTDLQSVLAKLSQKPAGRILIAGSLYLAGHVLEQLDSI